MSAVFALSRAHGKNIDRYHRLLKTALSDVERSYIEWRLSQEQAALEALDPLPQVDASLDSCGDIAN